MKQRKVNWSKEHPLPPPKDPSDWYFFIFEGEKDISIIEVWKDRSYWPDGLWGPRVDNIPENPLKEEVIKEKRKRKKLKSS